MNSGGCWTRGAGGTWKRVRLTKKTASTLVGKHSALHVLHGKRWKRLRAFGDVLDWGARSCKGERLSLHGHGFFLGRGWVVPHGLSARSRVSRFVLNLWLVACCCGLHASHCGHTHCERQPLLLLSPLPPPTHTPQHTPQHTPHTTHHTTPHTPHTTPHTPRHTDTTHTTQRCVKTVDPMWSGCWGSPAWICLLSHVSAVIQLTAPTWQGAFPRHDPHLCFDSGGSKDCRQMITKARVTELILGEGACLMNVLNSFMR